LASFVPCLSQPTTMAQIFSPTSHVLIFGDSWAAYPMVLKTWPMELAQLCGAGALNFAVPGSRADQLDQQVERLITSPLPVRTAAGDIHPESLAVIHTGGNDMMQKMGTDLLEHLPGKSEVNSIRETMEALYGAGVRRFVVSDVPFASCVPGVRMATPLIQSFVSSGQMAHLGLEPSDPAELAVELQATALHDQWEEMLMEFKKERPDSMVVHFDEAFALSRLRDNIGSHEFDTGFFDMTLIHPSAYGHRLLAQEAHKCLQLAC